MSLDDLDIRRLLVGHLPVIRACLDQLGVFAVLDEHLPQHPQAHGSDAECLAVMVLNILSGRGKPSITAGGPPQPPRATLPP
jgi:hypothetical protein